MRSSRDYHAFQRDVLVPSAELETSGPVEGVTSTSWITCAMVPVARPLSHVMRLTSAIAMPSVARNIYVDGTAMLAGVSSHTAITTGIPTARPTITLFCQREVIYLFLRKKTVTAATRQMRATFGRADNHGRYDRGRMCCFAQPQPEVN